jgi:hypothetical protein
MSQTLEQRSVQKAGGTRRKYIWRVSEIFNLLEGSEYHFLPLIKLLAVLAFIKAEASVLVDGRLDAEQVSESNGGSGQLLCQIKLNLMLWLNLSRSNDPERNAKTYNLRKDYAERWLVGQESIFELPGADDRSLRLTIIETAPSDCTARRKA